MDEKDFDRWLGPLKALRNFVPERYPLLRLAVPTQVLALTVALVLGLIIGCKRPPISCPVGLLTGLGILAVCETSFLILFFSLQPFLGKGIKLPGYVARLIDALRRSHPKDLVVTCVVVGCVEELFFRGALAPIIGTLPAALLFAAAHRPRAPFHWMTLTGLGLLFSLEVRLTGGLLVPMINHALHDLAALGILHVALKNDPTFDPLEQR